MPLQPLIFTTLIGVSVSGLSTLSELALRVLSFPPGNMKGSGRTP